MHELRFVGPADDSEHVRVESSDGLEQFNLLVDDALREAMKASAKPARDLTVTTVSPREIQVRVRAGEDPADLAAEAGIDVGRVLVFARPVLAERARITDEARRARARRSTSEAQLVVFGESVDERFAAHGLDPQAVTWDSYRREDGQWLVSASWRGGEADRSAEWAFTLAGRTVTPLDETAADLLSDRPIRPVVRAVPDYAEGDTGPLPDLSLAETSSIDTVGGTYDEVYDQDAVERAIADGTEPNVGPSAESTATLSPVAQPRSARTFEHRTHSRGTRNTNGGRLAMAPREARSKPDTRPKPDARPKSEARPGRDVAATAEPIVVHEAQIELFAEPTPVIDTPTEMAAPNNDGHTTELPNISTLAAARSGDEPNGLSLFDDESEEQKAERARIPSWDDILLGVRRKRD